MIKKILTIILSLSFVLGALLTVVDFSCFDHDFYKKEYRELNTANDIGVSDNDLDIMTDVLLDYLKDRNLTLDLKLKVNGIEREIFNEREKGHMIDVRELYLNAMSVRNFSIVVCVLSLISLILLKTKVFEYINGYKVALICFGILFACIGIACIVNFDKFWRFFHTIFFDNDLWLLNPRTDILIMMVPEKFFFDLVTKIVILSALCLISPFILMKVINKHEN